MAFAGRNPKDLRQMVADSHSDVDDMQANLAKLKCLSADDKTENAMLRSRIDEQSQLIMILKQSADDSTMKMRGIERINKELEKFRDEANDKLKMEIRRFNMLDARFNDLASNHEEIIKYKDEYKRQNEMLRRENAQILSENERLFSKAIDERDQIITEMDKKLVDLNCQCRSLDSKNKTLETQLLSSEERYRKDVKSLKSQLEQVEERLKGALAKLQQQINNTSSASAEATASINKLTKEKDELLSLAMQRGKVIQEKGSENKKLQLKIDDMEKSVRDMEEKFEREAASVNANMAVHKLRQELEEADVSCDQIIRDFEAFKKHSAGMLKKEQELNARLRHLVG